MRASPPARSAVFAWLDDDARPLDWNGPSTRPFVPVRDENLQRPIIEQFERVARQAPSRTAVRDEDGELTFGDLWNAASALAERLAADTTAGDLIAILLPAGRLFPIAMLACLAARRPFVVLDIHHSPEWLSDLLREARPALIVTIENRRQSIEARNSDMRMLCLSGVPSSASPTWQPSSMDVDEPACILFTSGSTGRPKSIVNSQRNLLQRVAQAINSAHINADDRLLTLASPATIVGVRDILTALLAGASIHLLDPHGVGAREIVKVIHAEDITILFAFPALLRSVVAARETRADAPMRLVRIGGDTTVWSDIETLRAWLAPEAAVQIVYAATEAPMMQWFVADDCRREDARVPIGYPLPGNRLALIDDDGHSTPPGDVGELVVGSSYVSLGSWRDGRLAGQDALTEGERDIRIVLTGDLVRQRPDGLLERIGRKDRQVKIRGSRVDLDGVEAMLRRHAFVRDVAVIARPHPADGTSTLVAYVSARDGAPPDLLDELRTMMRSAAAPMQPARFYREPSIPRLRNSKLDVRALMALDEAHVRREREQPTPAPVAAQVDDDDHIARAVARVWHDVLLVPARTAADDFFDSGGDSLKAITFVLELERALHFEIPVTLINEAPRFDRLCDALRERRAPGSTPLVTLKEGTGAPPLFFIHGVGGNVVEILPTARRVEYAGPVIGIRARGALRGETPHTTIEAMAADYLREIKQRQPIGPYNLCGYSSGGLVAFEMARRLSESGEDVGLVGLFDTTMSPVRWPLRTWTAIARSRLTRAAVAVARSSIRTWPDAFRRSAEGLRAWRMSLLATRSFGIKVAACALLASARYRPGFYAGELTLFSPTDRDPGLPDLERTWSRHARRVIVLKTPGTHLTMLSSRHAARTAASVTQCLPALSLPRPSGA